MSLVNMKTLIAEAQRTGKGVGAFNVGNMEMVWGLVNAAVATNTPVIMQIAEVRLDHSPLRFMGPMMVQAAKDAPIDIAVHLDHGKTMETIQEALKYGFTSVMFDGSHLPLEENIAKTKEVVNLAAGYGAAVEAELGSVGSANDGDERKGGYTDAQQAIRFVEETKVDALAVAIGNAHGNYQKTPKLQFELLSELEHQVPVPLVLHGGTGITPDDFQEVIRRGIRKVNVATANFDAVARYAKNYCQQVDPSTFPGLNEAMVAGMEDNVKNHICIFNTAADGNL